MTLPQSELDYLRKRGVSAQLQPSASNIVHATSLQTLVASIHYVSNLVQAPPPRTADEWARDKRIMPPSAPRPGKFNPDVNPYMRPVSWAFAQPCFDRVTFITATQMGKSVTMENIIGHRLDEDPTPIMYIAPTAPLLKDAVVPKFDDMIAECESLTAKLDVNRSSMFVKWIAGTKLRFVWAGSPSGLSADSAGLVMVDEVDRIVNTGEGSTVSLVERRGDAYDGSKIGYTATPTHGRVSKYKHEKSGLQHWAVAPTKAVRSAVWRLWQSGTRHEWAVPCPECGEYFIPWSGLLWWPGKGSENECTPDEAQKSARLTCPSHGCMIESKWRPSMNARGVAVAPGQSVNKAGEVIGVADTEGSTHFTFMASGLCSFSSKKTYGALAKDLLAAQLSNDPADLQAVYNTGFGECYAQAGDVPTWEEVRAQCFGYQAGALLLEPLRIFCTIDVQKNRLVYVIRAWYAGLGSMLLEHGELWGETDQDAVWEQLSELIDTDYDGHPITQTGIDIGYRDDQVYRFINEHKGRAMALRGRDRLDKPFRKEMVEVDRKGKTRKRGDARWAFDSPLAKRWVHSRFGRPDTRPGWWLLHQQVTDDYCKQLVGEEWREGEGKFHQVGENHYLDCEAMQYIMAMHAKLHRRKVGQLTKAQLREAIKAGPLADRLPDEPVPVSDADQKEPAEDLQEAEEAAKPVAKPAATRKADAPKAKAKSRFNIIRKPRR
ncbi:TPA: phage terminase large subunit family protein [Pseudomonas aeruginosa]|nr:phage terminase large subunit family protein [Pseudomonas aeruginosa]